MAKFQASYPIRILLTLASSLSLLAACNGPLVITPQPKPSSEFKTPPAIPDFPSQGPLPTALPGAGENRHAEMASGPVMAPAPAAAPTGAVSDSAGGASYDTGTGSSAKPGRDVSIMPIDPILPEPQIKPEAGLLTAGEWDDLKHWDFWLDLAQDSDWKAHFSTWGLYTQDRIMVKLEGSTGPMADCPVQLLDADSKKVLFEARTNTDGEAYLFSNLLGDSQASKFQVKAALGEETLTADVTDPDKVISLKAQTQLEPAVNADLMLYIDTTGSMGDELEYLKKELQNVAERIVKLNRQDLTLRLSANFYKDLTDEYVVRPFAFTEDAATVAKQLSQQSANGGGDFPEAVDVALADAVDEHKWSPTARARLMFLVLDAPAHQTPEVLKRLRTSLTRAAAKGIRIIPVASSGIDKETEFLLRSLAITSGGRYTFLTDDSGIGGGHLKPTIGDYKVEKLNDLIVRVATEYITGSTGSTLPPVQSASPSPEPIPSPTAVPDQELQQQ